MTRALLEAGGPADADAVSIPAAFSQLFKTRYDWAFTTGEQKHAGGRSLFWPRGKMLGGSSSINAMIYIRGTPGRLRRLGRRPAARAGPTTRCCPTSCAASTTSAAPRPSTPTGGPLNVSDLRSPHHQGLDFVAAAAAAGWPVNDDFNGAEQGGVGHYQVTMKRGRRHSTADAFLRPALGRPNLTVQTHALAHRVLVEGGRAVGVEYAQRGRTVVARAANARWCSPVAR